MTLKPQMCLHQPSIFVEKSATTVNKPLNRWDMHALSLIWVFFFGPPTVCHDVWVIYKQGKACSLVLALQYYMIKCYPWFLWCFFGCFFNIVIIVPMIAWRGFWIKNCICLSLNDFQISCSDSVFEEELRNAVWTKTGGESWLFCAQHSNGANAHFV